MRVTFWDIESTDLTAGFGRLLCCSFFDLGSDAVETFRIDRRPWKTKSIIDDSKLASAIRDRLHSADIVVGWNSKMFDAKFVQARLAKHGLAPLRLTKDHGTMHIDAMWSSTAMRIGSKRLDNISRFFDSPNRKTALDPDIWAAAATGDRESLDSVVEHCEADVRVLADLWPPIAQHVKNMVFSLSEVHEFITEIPSRQTSLDL
jgi:uncharacterized protein YprB with RNaseH-like and TPR domain